MTKQVVWTFRKFFFLQFHTNASKQQRFAKIGTILRLLLSTQISQVSDIPRGGTKMQSVTLKA